jgi:hypothetical protein
MLEELFEYLKPREEKVTIGKHSFVVRELTGNVDMRVVADGSDVEWKTLVRCVFRESGEQAFSDDDIPRLKSSGTAKIAPLRIAMHKVNGLELEPEVKNSDAAQS